MIRQRMKMPTAIDLTDLGNIKPHLARAADTSATAIRSRMKVLSWNAQAGEWQ